MFDRPMFILFLTVGGADFSPRVAGWREAPGARPAFGACGKAGPFIAAEPPRWDCPWRCVAEGVAKPPLLQPQVALLSYRLVKGLKTGLGRVQEASK